MFDGYFCGVTGLPCCGCSLFCQHRREDNRLMKEERKYYLLTNGKYNFIKCYTKSELDYTLKVTNWKIVKVI